MLVVGIHPSPACLARDGALGYGRGPTTNVELPERFIAPSPSKDYCAKVEVMWQWPYSGDSDGTLDCSRRLRVFCSKAYVETVECQAHLIPINQRQGTARRPVIASSDAAVILRPNAAALPRQVSVGHSYTN